MQKKNRSFSIRNKLREAHRRMFMQDPFNNPAMIAMMDAAAKLAPNGSFNEAEIRRRDRDRFAGGLPSAGTARAGACWRPPEQG